MPRLCGGHGDALHGGGSARGGGAAGAGAAAASSVGAATVAVVSVVGAAGGDCADASACGAAGRGFALDALAVAADSFGMRMGANTQTAISATPMAAPMTSRPGRREERCWDR